MPYLFSRTVSRASASFKFILYLESAFKSEKCLFDMLNLATNIYFLQKKLTKAQLPVKLNLYLRNGVTKILRKKCYGTCYRQFQRALTSFCTANQSK